MSDTGSTRPRSEIEALSHAVGAVGGLLDVEAVLQVIVDTARELVNARYAALGIFDDKRRIEQFVTSGITVHERALLGPLPEGHGLLGLIVEQGQTIRVPDIAAHPASYGFPPGHPPMHSLLGVPVRNKNRTLGNFYLTDKSGGEPFTDDDQRLVELFALHAGIAMDNARLHEAAGRLAVLEERDRIGKDLHDGIIQSIYGVSLSLEDVLELMDSDGDEARARVDRAIDALHGTIRDLRGFIFGLRPELVDRTDLVGLLVALTEQLRQNSLVEVTVQLPEERVTASPHVRAELLQIAREALSNVARHSGASEVDVALAVDGTALVLDVTDNGRGFDPAEVAPDGHFGLANMRDRATALGGDLTIASAAGAGTHIIVRIPTVSDDEARTDDD